MTVIYLDYHSTTPCDPRVLEVMLPYFTSEFGNPSSTTHAAGRAAAAAVEEARGRVAALIGASPGEIFFTSGATESNNLAIVGIAQGGQRSRQRIVTTAIEHKAVLAPVHKLGTQGFEIIKLPVDADGLVVLDAAQRAINEHTLLVSVQLANNEVGTIQSVGELTNLAHDHGALVHCDAAQAVGRIPIDVDALDVDLMSMSAHKIYGPKGVGALYVRGGAGALAIEPLCVGGGQERELRPGTLNVPGIVGFGEACKLCLEALPAEATRICALRDRLEEVLLSRICGLRRNGALNRRLPGNSSITFPGIDAEALIANTSDVAFSTGSACTSGAMDPSHVLLALGLSREDAYATARIGIGRFTTQEEIERACEAIIEAFARVSDLVEITHAY